MKLFTKAQETTLRTNWTRNAEHEERTGKARECRPVVKLFCPWGAATWLISEMNPTNPDVLFGLCDLGHGEPELGYVSRKELEALRGPGLLRIERDYWFTPDRYLSAYATDAARERRIVA